MNVSSKSIRREERNIARIQMADDLRAYIKENLKDDAATQSLLNYIDILEIPEGPF